MTNERQSNSDFFSRREHRFLAMTERALMIVFEYTESDAQTAVREMFERFPESYMRDTLRHEDALNLAAAIANAPATELGKKEPWAARLPAYREAVRCLAAEALEDHETHGKRIEAAARIRERAHRLWVQDGSREDSPSEAYWLKAEAEVASEAQRPGRIRK
jgi:Protein of unknown function (DUF2934)